MEFQTTLKKARSTIESRNLLTETLSTLCYFFCISLCSKHRTNYKC